MAQCFHRCISEACFFFFLRIVEIYSRRLQGTELKLKQLHSSVFSLWQPGWCLFCLTVCPSVHSSGEVDQTNRCSHHRGSAAHWGRRGHRGNVRLLNWNWVFYSSLLLFSPLLTSFTFINSFLCHHHLWMNHILSQHVVNYCLTTPLSFWFLSFNLFYLFSIHFIFCHILIFSPTFCECFPLPTSPSLHFLILTLLLSIFPPFLTLSFFIFPSSF